MSHYMHLNTHSHRQDTVAFYFFIPDHRHSCSPKSPPESSKVILMKWKGAKFKGEPEKHDLRRLKWLYVMRTSFSFRVQVHLFLLSYGMNFWLWMDRACLSLLLPILIWEEDFLQDAHITCPRSSWRSVCQSHSNFISFVCSLIKGSEHMIVNQLEYLMLALCTWELSVLGKHSGVTPSPNQLVLTTITVVKQVLTRPVSGSLPPISRRNRCVSWKAITLSQPGFNLDVWSLNTDNQSVEADNTGLYREAHPRKVRHLKCSIQLTQPWLSGINKTKQAWMCEMCKWAQRKR